VEARARGLLEPSPPPQGHGGGGGGGDDDGDDASCALAAFNAALSACARAARWESALSLLREMREGTGPRCVPCLRDRSRTYDLASTTVATWQASSRHFARSTLRQQRAVFIIIIFCPPPRTRRFDDALRAAHVATAARARVNDRRRVNVACASCHHVCARPCAGVYVTGGGPRTAVGGGAAGGAAGGLRFFLCVVVTGRTH